MEVKKGNYCFPLKVTFNFQSFDDQWPKCPDQCNFEKPILLFLINKYIITTSLRSINLVKFFFFLVKFLMTKVC